MAVQIFGHEHVDTFRLLGQRTVALTAPSLSTGYPRTNPTFRKWRHDPAGTGRVIDYDQYHLDLLAANARHGGDATISAAAGGGAAGEGGTDQGGSVHGSSVHGSSVQGSGSIQGDFHKSYSFREEYDLPDLSRKSYEALLARFTADAHGGQAGAPGWECSADRASDDALFVPGRSASQKDPGFNATRAECEALCSATPPPSPRPATRSSDGGTVARCSHYQWGHTVPDFAAPFGWCYLWRRCGPLTADASGPEYEPKYAVWPQGVGPDPAKRSMLLSENGTAYARERRFFLSSTPLQVQPRCDKWCQIQDLCDKATSGIIGTDACFTMCTDTGGRALETATLLASDEL